LHSPLFHTAAAIRAIIVFILRFSHRYLRRVLSSIHLN
jgi:hypothetical protein